MSAGSRNGVETSSSPGGYEGGGGEQGPEQDGRLEDGLRNLTLGTDTSLKDLDKLWGSHYDQFMRFGLIDDIEKAIEYATRALHSTPEGDPDLASRHSNLGISYDDRFQRLGKLDDLERAIEHGSHAVALAPQGHADLALEEGNLGNFYRDRFKRLGEMQDLEQAIEHKTHALELTPDGHPHLSRRHGALGVSYGDRYQRLGEPNDLEKAIEHKTRALELIPDGSEHLPRRHVSLGESYADRFLRLGDMHDLERAIKHKTRALELTPDGHPHLSIWHASLGVSYGHRFDRKGDLDDLEKEIEHLSRALELTPDGHPILSRRHAILGASYGDRFQRLGELHDLERAIEHGTRALELTPDDHPELSRRYASLGVDYTERFERLDEMHDLEKAIEYLSRALELTPDGHPDLSDWHASLGVSYGDRFDRLDEMDDLEQAIEHHTRALELTPDGHPDLSFRHNSLGFSYATRFESLGEVRDLEKAIEHHTRALELTPDGHPDLTDRYFSRAYTFVLQYQHTNDHTYLESSLEYYRKASQLSTGAPRRVFQNALDWAQSSDMDNSPHRIEAYQTTIDLLPHFIWLGATTHQRYEDLSTVESLAVNAASAAIEYSEPKLALEWLEHARCVVWNQSLMLRSPLDDLQHSYPDLAAHFRSVSEQLHEAGSESLDSSLSVDLERVARQRRQLAKEYRDLLAQTRSLPGFENFLRPAGSSQLVHAARNGSIVIINCSESRCDAILIPNGNDQVYSIPLPDFSQEKAQHASTQIRESLRHQGARERGAELDDDLKKPEDEYFQGIWKRGAELDRDPEEDESFQDILTTLWYDIVKPVLDFLGYTNKLPTGTLPHLTWCPTGAVSFLPLHAAGDYDKPHSTVFDYVVSSYTPTLTALLSSSPISLGPGSRVLGIGQEATSIPGYRLSRLPGTTKELDRMRHHTVKTNQIQFSRFTGDQATKLAVLDAMEQHDWVHLACHAHQNVNDATESGFFLHDGILDLASINRRSFKNKGLAFLSACQTATGDEKLPDEAVHLASGMLMAGYPSVIATMWSVVDSDAPFVADRVYAELMKDGKVGNGEGGRALHNAVEALREEVGTMEFGRWVPYIHIGS